MLPMHIPELDFVNAKRFRRAILSALPRAARKHFYDKAVRQPPELITVDRV